MSSCVPVWQKAKHLSYILSKVENLKQNIVKNVVSFSVPSVTFNIVKDDKVCGIEGD